MCANILSLSLLKAEQNKEIQGIKIGRNVSSFTHLFLADDSLFFFKKGNKSNENMQHILHWYCSLSGSVSTLQNLTMISEDQTSIAMSLNINLVKTPSKYLGLDFKLKGKRVVDFHFLVAKITSKL